jgi:hypothetical protein
MFSRCRQRDWVPSPLLDARKEPARSVSAATVDASLRTARMSSGAASSTPRSRNGSSTRKVGPGKTAAVVEVRRSPQADADGYVTSGRRLATRTDPGLVVHVSRAGPSVRGPREREHDKQDEQHGRAGERTEEDRDGEGRPLAAAVSAKPELLGPAIFGAGAVLLGLGARARNLPISSPEGYSRKVCAATTAIAPLHGG